MNPVCGYKKGIQQRLIQNVKIKKDQMIVSRTHGTAALAGELRKPGKIKKKNQMNHFNNSDSGFERIIEDPSVTCDSTNQIIFIGESSFDNTLLYFNKISAANVAFGILFNIIAVGICNGIGFKGTLFAYYFQFIFLKNILVIIMIHLRHQSLFAYTTKESMIPPESCVSLFYMYQWSNHDQICSLFLLCINRIKEQYKTKVFDNYIDTLRWPFLLNTLLSLFLIIPTMQYKFIREKQHKDDVNTRDLTGKQRCILTFQRPNCLGRSNTSKALAITPFVEDIFTVILLIMLGLEIILKKRRWAKHSSNLATTKNQHHNFGHDPIGDGDVSYSPKRRSVTSAFDEKLWLLFNRLERAQRQSLKGSRASAFYKTSEGSTSTVYNIKPDPITIEKIVTPVSKTNMAIALITVNLVTRLPDHIVRLPFFASGSFFYELRLKEEVLIGVQLLKQFGLVIPALLSFALSPYYRHAANSWLTAKNVKVTDLRLTQEDATELRTRLLHHKNNVLVYGGLDHLDSFFNLTDVPGIDENLETSLTSGIDKINRQSNILDLLAEAKDEEEAEDMDLEEFPQNYPEPLPDRTARSHSPSVISGYTGGVPSEWVTSSTTLQLETDLAMRPHRHSQIITLYNHSG